MIEIVDPFFSTLLVAIAINCALAVVLAVAIGYLMRWHQPQTIIFQFILFAFVPLHAAIGNFQPTILMAIGLTSGLLAIRNRRYYLAGALLAICGVKPHWALISLSASRWAPRALPPLVTVGLVFFVLPFAFLGPGVILDYVHLVTSRGESDLGESQLSYAVLSWTGFFRALTGTAQFGLWLSASLITISVAGFVWLITRK